MELPAAARGAGPALRGIASSAIDLSDGLLGDLGHVMRRSGVGARVDLDAVPRSALLASLPQAMQRTCTLHGGDDYELLFSAAPSQRAAVLDAARAADVSGHLHRPARGGRGAGGGRRRGTGAGRKRHRLRPLPHMNTEAHDARRRAAPLRASCWRHPAHLVALGFGSGLSPRAPGTVGTLWAWVSFLVLDRWLGDAAMGRRAGSGPACRRLGLHRCARRTWAWPTRAPSSGTRSSPSGSCCG